MKPPQCRAVVGRGTFGVVRLVTPKEKQDVRRNRTPKRRFGGWETSVFAKSGLKENGPESVESWNLQFKWWPQKTICWPRSWKNMEKSGGGEKENCERSRFWGLNRFECFCFSEPWEVSISPVPFNPKPWWFTLLPSHKFPVTFGSRYGYGMLCYVKPIIHQSHHTPKPPLVHVGNEPLRMHRSMPWNVWRNRRPNFQKDQHNLRYRYKSQRNFGGKTEHHVCSKQG